MTVIEDRFDEGVLDERLWVDHYLPHWTTPERSRARYDFEGGGLRLRIDADQPAWRPADGPMRVSNIQTGTFSGPLGSTAGTHRHRLDGLTVVTPQPTRRLWTPKAGSVEVTARASTDPGCMLGIWLVGFEADGPDDSGEICLAELFADRVGAEVSTVRTGIKAHHDPRLETDMADVVLPIDTSDVHRYAAEWGSNGVRILVDGEVIRASTQRIDYELQLMIDLFEFPDSEARPAAAYPKTAYVLGVAGDGTGKL